MARLVRRKYREDDHASQILARCNCRGFAGCGRAGGNFRRRLGRLASWRLAPWLGLWWSPHRRRRPRLLRRWLWRLLRAAPGRNSLGSALAAGEPLLLIRFELPLTTPR